MAESLKERQDNELEALQAIFMDDFRDLRAKDSGSVPPHITLKLQPCESMRQNESHVSLDLNVKYPKEYPNRSPAIKLENTKGISKDKVLELEKEVQCMAANLVGEVMVLQLAQHVQNFLHQNNVPPPPSFYEEMMAKKKRDVEQQNAAEKEKKEKERKANVIQLEEEKQQIREEMVRREEALKNLKKRNLKEKENLRVGLMTQSTPNEPEKRMEEGPTLRERINRKSISEDVLPYDGLRVVTFHNKKQHTVHCGKCLGYGPSGSSVFCGLDILCGEVVALSEWHFKGLVPKKPTPQDQTKVDDEKLSKQLSSIEQEISSLITRVNHCNLVHYLGVTQVHKSNTVTLQILTEFIVGGSLTKELRPGGVPLEIVKEYTQQLLEVLAYLHGKSIVHKDIRLSSIFIDQEKNLRLADYSVGRRLCDLYQTYGERKLSKKMTIPEVKGSHKYTKKTDILSVGLLILSLLEGDIVSSVPPTISQSFPADLQDFFARCLYPDDGDQWSALQLLNHSFIAPAPPSNSVLNDGTGNGDGMESARDQLSHAQENVIAADESVSLIPFSCVNVVGKSRLKSEFEVLQWLGKGGFGSVVKVRNNLDGCLYAIKRIPLNPRSVQFNRKITREVKLLSRLNHENIVRYYNSWIEVEEEPDSESSTSEAKSSDLEQKEKSTTEDSLMKLNQIEEPSMCATRDDDSWASEKTSNADLDEREANSFSSSDEEDIRTTTKIPASGNPNESSEDIMFRRNIEDSIRQFGSSLAHEEEESDYEIEEETTTESSQYSKGGLQHLYIQMEFCEKSTLRSVIDEGLYKNQERIWRLLREIVEGLVHVHSQGMIHRDLKPVNIFLDSNDRVKIGDFGLATTHPFTKGGSGVPTETDLPKISVENTATNESMTGKVGTALYVSPELGNAISRIRYTPKVDLYSLGIIFFEMCYRPLETTMERVQILGNLRTEKIILPIDFDMKGLEKQAYIIQWLLHHNPDERPTSQELLKSQHIPPKIEDNELEEILNHTLATTNSTRYQTLISFMMNQEIAQSKLDLMYDYDLITAQFSNKHAVVQQLVHEKLVHVFRRHGVLMLNTPLLVPKVYSKVYKQAETSVNMMDHSGAILTLPYDLRTSLARYLARNNFPPLKRYSISHVYRDTRVLGVHPREHCSCALDIATSSPSEYVPDAEILCIVEEIIHEFPSLDARNYYIRINHATLTRAILAANGVVDEKIPDVLLLLQEARGELDCLQHLKKFLESLPLSDDTVVNVCRWLLTETPMDAAKSALGHMARGRRTVNHRIRNAIQDLQKIVKHAVRLGLTLHVMLYPSLVDNVQNMSGVLFQFVAEKKRKVNFSGIEILAAGGRYDKLISVFCRGSELPAGYGAVGVSINVERVIQSVLQDPDRDDLHRCDVFVCAVGENALLEDRTNIVRRLNMADISASIWYEPLTDVLLDETQAYCRDCGIQYLVIVEEKAPTRIRIIEKEKEIKGVDDPVEYLKQKFQEPVESSERDIPAHVGNKMTPTSGESNTQSQLKFDIDFVTQDKLERNVKRRHESHMKSKVTQILQSKNPYLTIGVDLPVSVLKSIAALLDLSDDNSETKFTASVKMICEKLKQIKYRRHVPTVCDKILKEKASLASPVLFLYSSTDEQCVIMQV